MEMEKLTLKVVFCTKNFQGQKTIFFSLEFIGGISQFSVKGDKESKLKCKFFRNINKLLMGFSF